MNELTSAQKVTLDAITKFWGEFKRPPTIHEMSSILNCSTGHVGNMLAKLREKGYIHKRRGIHILESEVVRPLEAADLIGVSRSTMNPWMQEGYIKTIVSPSGQHLIEMSEVNRIIALRKTPKFGIDFNTDPLWSAWLTGFTDGEGTFQIIHNKRRKQFTARYALFQRADRVAFLLDIQKTLQCGHIYNRGKYQPPTGPGSYYVVVDQTSLVNIIIPFFDKYPVRLKSEEYQIWREAVFLIVNGNDDFDRLFTIRETLRDLYAYNPSRQKSLPATRNAP